MHVLITTPRTQGQQPDDFDHTVPGELVRFPGVECGDPACGCGRAFAGLASARATTTAEVVDRPDLTPVALWGLLLDDLLGQVPEPLVQVDDLVLLVADWLELAQVAASLPPGTVVGRADGQVTIREHGPLSLARG